MAAAIILAALFAAGAAAQVTAIFKPMSLASTRNALGKGREIGVWSVSACNDTAANLVLPKQRLMFAAPAIHELPNKMAEDALIRKANKDPRSTIGVVGDSLLSIAAMGLTTGGLIAKTNNPSSSAGSVTAYVGIGLTIGQVVLSLVKRNAPDPAIYAADLLPETIGLGPGQCGTWVVVSGLVRDAKTIGPIQIGVK